MSGIGLPAGSRSRSRRAAATTAALVVAVSLTGCSIASPTEPGRAGPTTSAPGTVVVPLDIVHEGSAILAIVPVRVDGKGPYPFVLDTGASTSGINAALAAQLELPRTGGSSTVSGVVSSTQVPLVRVAKWSVGGVVLRPTTIGALTFGTGAASTTAPSSTSRIAGLLGSDQLSRFGSITVDYQAQQLRFTTRTGG